MTCGLSTFAVFLSNQHFKKIPNFNIHGVVATDKNQTLILKGITSLVVDFVIVDSLSDSDKTKISLCKNAAYLS